MLLLFSRFFVALLALGGGFSWAASPPDGETSPNLLLIADASSDSHIAVLQHFRIHLNKDLSTPTQNRLLVLESSDAPELAEAIDKAALTVTSGYESAVKVLQQNPRKPVVALLLSRPQLDTLQQRFPTAALTGIYNSQPFVRQLALATTLIPDVRKVSVLLGPDSGYLKHEFATQAEWAEVKLEAFFVRGNDLPQRALNAIAPDSEILIALDDPYLFTPENIKAVMLTTYRHRLPLIGTSPLFIEAGAMVALYSEPLSVGQQAAKMARTLLRNSTATVPEPVFPYAFQVRINPFVAESMGFPQLDQLRLHDAINSRESRIFKNRNRQHRNSNQHPLAAENRDVNRTTVELSQ